MFAPVPGVAGPLYGACISCIYWEDQQECFVTGVDIIFLLEQLLSARLTVTKKASIRGNLGNFGNMMVSKQDSETREFFDILMAFPAPKPRNIEKDIRIFYWKDLGSILKKTIGSFVRAQA